MKEKEIIEKVKEVLFSKLGYSSEHVKEEVLYFGRDSFRFDLIVSLWQDLFFIETNIHVKQAEKEQFIDRLNKQAYQNNIPYFVLITYNLGGIEKWHIFKSNENKPIGIKDINELHISKFIPKIQKIHFDSFLYLYEEKYKKDESFTFYLRGRGKEQLEKGYFFLGNDDCCFILFWTGQDWKNKSTNIYLEINIKGYVLILLTAKDSDKKAKFLSQVAEIIGAKPIKTKEGQDLQWAKIYTTNWQQNYLEVLKEFVRVDKEIIDGQILKEKNKKDNNLEDIGFISIDIFKKNLQKILPYRNKLSHDSIQNIEKKEENQPIKLQNVEFQHISMFESFSIDLSNQVTCIIGDNGTGKTTLLRAVILGLTGVNESTEINPEELKYSELQKLLQMNGLDKNGNISYQGNGKVSVEYLMDKKYTNTVLLQKQKNSLDIVLSDDLSSDGFVALSDSNYFPNLVIGFTQGGRAQSYKFGTYEKQRGNVGDVSALLFNAKQEHFEELEQWIFELDGDSANDKRAKQVLNFVFEVVTGVIGMKITLHKVEHQRKEVWVKIADGELVLFNLISQGFTKVFAWIGYFIKRLSECNSEMENFKDAPAILLIDEIDTYLHPKWQRNILAFLAETFTNTQFIVTTHSPLVANYLNPAKIKGGVALYRLEKGTTEPKKFEKIYGRDLSAVFFDWMGVPNRNPEIDKEIDEILHLISKETPESLKAAKEKIAKIQMEEYDEIMAEIKSSLEYAEEHLGG